MGRWNDKVVPVLVDKMANSSEISALRKQVLSTAHGDVLEIGFGSGLNLAHYPPSVTKIIAVEPSLKARRMAQQRMERDQPPVEFVGLDGQNLPLANQSVDTVVSTFTLCTIPDPSKALSEAARVLKPGGQIHILEHGLSAKRSAAKWQHRLSPVQEALFGGCHLDRQMEKLVEEAGYRLVYSNQRPLPGSIYLGNLYEIIASPKSPPPEAQGWMSHASC